MKQSQILNLDFDFDLHGDFIYTNDPDGLIELV